MQLTNDALFSVDSETGWVSGLRQLLSPNCDARPEGAQVEVIVLHGISLPAGQFGGDAVIRLFLNQLDVNAHPSFFPLKGLKVSAHFLIRRDGEIFQFVPVTMRAWHAGISSCLGRAAVNDFSIGVELEGTDTNPYEEAQYRSLARLNQSLIREFPAVTADHLFGHSDIAPDRKSDPGPCFDWARCRRDAVILS